MPLHNSVFSVVKIITFPVKSFQYICNNAKTKQSNCSNYFVMNFKNIFHKKPQTEKPKKSKLREWVDAIVFAVVAATIIRGLLFSAYAIPSGSMESSLLTGDYLFVSKISYGPRMPFTPISIPFTEPEVFGMKTYWSGWQLPYMRLPGFGSPQKGDVVVFNKPEEIEKPIDARTTLIKRCQAAPGDKLQIIDAHVYINGKRAFEAPGQQTSYNVITDGTEINPQVLTDMSIEVTGQKMERMYEMIIPAAHLGEFKNLPFVKSVTPVVAQAGEYDQQVFPHSDKMKWNEDNFGPLVMPKRGMTIPLNDSTLTLYRTAMVNYEHNTVEGSGSNIVVNGKPASTYTFKMDYYWMMGDNRHNSLDSRFWGYVPEDHIIGKAMITFMSTDSTKSFVSKIRWNRILRAIK